MNVLQLLESPKDEIQLQQIAAAVINHVNQKLIDGHGDNHVDLKLKDLPKGTLGHLYTRLRSTDVAILFRSNSYEGGTFSEFFGSITVNAPVRFDGDRGHYVMVNAEAATSTLIHELRHKLDHSLRGKKRFNDREEYLLQPHEINARFSQVQADLVRELKGSAEGGNVMTLREFIHRFEQLSVKYNLMQVFARDDQVIANFAEFIDKGAFGMKLPHDKVKSMTNALNNRSDEADIGAFSDPRYRGLIRRLSSLYYYVVEGSKKAR